MRADAASVLGELADLAAESGEVYVQAAAWAGTDDLGSLFRLLAGQRRAMSAALTAGEAAPHSAVGEGAPAATSRLMDRLRSSFVADRPRALIEECERADTTLAHCLVTVDERRLPPEAVALVRACHAEVVASLGQLAAARVRLRGR